MHLDCESFDELLNMFTPKIKNQNTMLRDTILPSQHLSIKLRYLATGNTFKVLKFTSAMSPQVIRKIVMKICKAIIWSLKDYIKIRKVIKHTIFCVLYLCT